MRKGKYASAVEVEEAIRRDIEARYPPGSLLPTRREMAEEYQASLQTLQKALRSLEERGLVIVRPSVGTVVAPRGETGPQLIERSGTGPVYPPGQYATFTYCGMDTPPDEVAEAMGLEPREQAIVRRRHRRSAEGATLSMSESWYHPRHREAAPLLLEEARIREGSFVYLMERTGLREHSKAAWVVCRPATDTEREHLALDEDGIVIVERVVIKAEDGEYIEYGISSRPGHLPYPVRK